MPLVPVLELLRSMLGIAEREPAEEARRKAAGTLLLVDLALHDELPLIFELLGIAEPDAPAARGGDPEARQRRLLTVVRRLVEHLAARQPHLLVVEDLHWLDPGSEAFLRAIADVVPQSRTLLLVDYRPEYERDAAWLGHAPFERVRLAPLDERSTGELLDELVGREPSLGDLAARIARQTAGNPFFVEETVRALADAGHLEGRRAAARRHGGAARDPADGARRAHRSPAGGREVAPPDGGGDRQAVRAARARARVRGAGGGGRARAGGARAGRVRPPRGRAARVQPSAPQEVADRSQLAARREHVHAAVAAALEAEHAGSLDDVAALIAHHRERAGDALGAARWLRRAAERATRNDVAEAMRLWTRVGDLVADLPQSPEAVELGTWSGIQRLNLGWRVGLSVEEAERIFTRGMELAKLAPDHSAQAGFLVTYRAVKGLSGKGADAIELLHEGARLAQEADDAGTELAIRCALVQSQLMIGDLPAALATAEAALSRTRATPGLDTHGWLLAMRGTLKKDSGDLRGAERDFAEALEHARRLGENEILGWTHEMRANLVRWGADAERALADAREAVHVAERIGSSFSQASAYASLGLVLRMTGDLEGAVAALEHAMRVTASAARSSTERRGRSPSSPRRGRRRDAAKKRRRVPARRSRSPSGAARASWRRRAATCSRARSSRRAAPRPSRTQRASSTVRRVSPKRPAP